MPRTPGWLGWISFVLGIAGTIAAFVIFAPGIEGSHTITQHVTSPPVSCPQNEVRAYDGECVPAGKIKVPGVEGSGVKPDGARPVQIQVTPGLTGSSIHISGNGLHLIEMFEGFSSCPYWDPYGGVWTRGFGETEGIHRSSACISRTFGSKNLKYRVERFYQWAIRGLGVNLNQNEIDALDSFAWNLGAGIFTGSLRSALRLHAPKSSAARIMLAYVHAGGQVLAGLVRRRRAEVALLLKPVAKPKPVSRRDLEARLRALRRALDSHGCRKRRAHHQKLGPKCARWFREGDAVHRRLASI